ncbi:unnamed protein product [Paramecium octaurelia]|uniref:Uncharacterized protein n=1 Tax=Paramecium octaurelia TaxID=43137 RepID=A0A8S1XGS7_PAROT|nr:unnamed protein product [Paramecium octaurelia]
MGNIIKIKLQRRRLKTKNIIQGEKKQKICFIGQLIKTRAVEFIKGIIERSQTKDQKKKTSLIRKFQDCSLLQFKEI